MRLPLVSVKSFRDFTPEEYHAHVTAMYALRKEKKAESCAPGISLTLTKKGAISIRRVKNKRAFAYVTRSEIEALAKESGHSMQILWTAFREADYIISNDRMEAEKLHANLEGIPWK